MAYCVGNCLAWDTVSGNLTINEDPLGGLECLPDGQRIRIAGGNTGVAVNNKNNGLFMTTAGELGTKVTPQFKNFSSQSAQSSNPSGTLLSPDNPYSYAITPNMVCANPSSIYPMLVSVNYFWWTDFSINPNTNAASAMVFSGQVYINGAQQRVAVEQIGFDHFNAASGGDTTISLHQTQALGDAYIVAPSSSITIAARIVLTGSGPGGVIHYTSNTKFTATAMIGEFI